MSAAIAANAVVTPPGSPGSAALGRHLVQPWPAAGELGREERPVITGSDGIFVCDESGNRVIDGPAGMWCVQVGHRQERLARVLRDQAMELTYASPWHSVVSPASRLADALAARAPGDLDHAFFTTCGSTAVETALRFMQFWNNIRGRSDKKCIVTRGGAYHGSTYLTGSLNGKPRDRDWMDAADDLVLRLTCPDPFRREAGESVEAFTDRLLGEFEALVEGVGAERIGAFVAEPIQASGGVIVPPPGYLTGMREVCRRNDILFISDEVVTAFGRLGPIFASEEVFGLDPDMITFAKGVTSGYFPLGGVLISARLLDAARAAGRDQALFANGFTYSSHPIGCAVALENLAVLEGGILDHVRDIAPYFQARLRTLEDLALVGEVRGMGLMACVECVADRVSRNPLALDIKVGQRIDQHCQALGLLVRPIINMCVMSPPLIIQRPDIDRMVEILRLGITRTMDDLTREGVWRG
jgi:adenosylmethionine-8-amino-7-oxononanoate aminotransferase